MILECVVDIGGAGGDTAVLPAAHTQPVIVATACTSLKTWGGGGELKLVLIPSWIIFFVLPVMVSFFQSFKEGDKTAEDDDNNNHDDNSDHGPGGLSWGSFQLHLFRRHLALLCV